MTEYAYKLFKYRIKSWEKKKNNLSKRKYQFSVFLHIETSLAVIIPWNFSNLLVEYLSAS